MTPVEAATRRPLPGLGDHLDVARVGGKAAVLAQLACWGFPVPPAVVVPHSVFEHWLTNARLAPRIDRLCADVDARRPETARTAAAAIAQLIDGAPFTEEVEAALADAADRLLPDAPVVVRSSAVGEDGATASFAGQLDSILHVATPAGLADALRRCWASYWSDRALWYRAARGVRLAGMGVLIQRQVAAVESGVVFTRDPQGADAILIESCPGLADGLVSGRVDPARRLVPRDRVASDDVARIAAAIEARFGRPQDIEWARDEAGTVWIVQARPITTAPSPVAAAARMPDGRARHVWSNANVSENFPTPISPLLYSIASVGYYHYFRNLGFAFGVSRRRLRAMDRPLRTIVGAHGARLYYNLTNIHAVLRMAPFGDGLARAFNAFVGVEDLAAAPPGAVTWRDRRRRVSQALELVRIAAATSWQYVFFRRRLESFERTADAFGAATRPDLLRDQTLKALAGHLQRFVDIRCAEWKDASLADAASMVCYALLGRTLTAIGGDAGVLHRLIRALPGVPSSQPPLRLWALSRLIRQDDTLRRLFRDAPTAVIETRLRTDEHFAAFRAEFDRYLEEWGFRSSAELMLTTPTLQERPGPVIDLLRQYADRDAAAPEAVMAAEAADRRSETRRLVWSTARRAPHLAAALWVLLRWTHTSIAFRERARLKQALLYTRCRHVALAIGDHLVAAGRLPARDDIFLLTWQEIGDLAAGRAMFAGGTAGLVALRRQQHDDLARMTPPDHFELEEGASLETNADSTVAPPASDETTDVGDLRGTGASAGRVTARAAVLADVTDSHRLGDGDVLVTRQTDPGWGPVFCLVSGLVIERGGMLSHGAIIAREFGLPCVVGIAGATTRIRHGDRVTVDGTAGTCRIETTSPEAAPCS